VLRASGAADWHEGSAAAAPGDDAAHAIFCRARERCRPPPIFHPSCRHVCATTSPPDMRRVLHAITCRAVTLQRRCRYSPPDAARREARCRSTRRELLPDMLRVTPKRYALFAALPRCRAAMRACCARLCHVAAHASKRRANHAKMPRAYRFRASSRRHVFLHADAAQSGAKSGTRRRQACKRNARENADAGAAARAA